MAKEFVFAIEQNFAQFHRTVKSFAGRHFARGIDRFAVSFEVAPTAHPIEILQSEADGVHQIMAAGASRIGTMAGKDLPHGEALFGFCGRLKRRHISRRRRHGCTQQSIQNPSAAQHGAALLIVGGHGENTRHAEHTGAIFIGPLNLSKRVVETGDFVFNLVIFRQTSGEESVVGGEQFEQTAIVAEDVVIEQHGFLAQFRRAFWCVVMLQFGKQRNNASTHFLRAEPLADEARGEGARAGIVDHAICLGGEYRRILQPPLRGKLQQLGIRRGGPKEVREPRGHIVLRDRLRAGLGGRIFNMEEEARGDQNGFEGNLDALFIGIATFCGPFVKREERRGIRGGDWSPVCRREKRLDQLASGAAGVKRGFPGFQAEEAVMHGALIGRRILDALFHKEAEEFDRMVAIDYGDAVDASGKRGKRGAGSGSTAGITRVVEAAKIRAIKLHA